MSKTLVYPHASGGSHAFTFISLCMRVNRTTRPCVLSCKFKEIIHGHSHFGLKKASRFVISSGSSDETGLTKSPLKRLGENTSKIPQSSKSKRKTANQEEILSLFRKIQASIAKGESARAKRTKPKPNDEKPTVESILEILHHSQKQGKDNNAAERGNKTRTTIGSLAEEENEVEATPLPTTNYKLTRPPSNFIKRSPILAPSTPRGLDRLANPGNEGVVIPDDNELELELELGKLNKMKLSVLKEIAKSQGRKGYSKLKKKELVELLMS